MGDEHLSRMLADAVDVIVPLHNQAGEFHIKEVWYKDDAARRNETATGRSGKRGNSPSEGCRGSGGGASEGSGGRLTSILAASTASMRSSRRARAV